MRFESVYEYSSSSASTSNNVSYSCVIQICNASISLSPLLLLKERITCQCKLVQISHYNMILLLDFYRQCSPPIIFRHESYSLVTDLKTFAILKFDDTEKFISICATTHTP